MCSHVCVHCLPKLSILFRVADANSTKLALSGNGCAPIAIGHWGVRSGRLSSPLSLLFRATFLVSQRLSKPMKICRPATSKTSSRCSLTISSTLYKWLWESAPSSQINFRSTLEQTLSFSIEHRLLNRRVDLVNLIELNQSVRESC